MYMTQPDRQRIQHIRVTAKRSARPSNDIPALKQSCEEQLAEN